MKSRKYLYMTLGGIITLAIAGAVFMFSRPTQAAQTGLVDRTAEGFGGDDVFHPVGPRGFGKRGAGVAPQALESFLIEELGLTQEEFDAAREEAHSAAIIQAVEAGLLSEAQAEALEEGARFGDRVPRGFGGPRILEEAGINPEQLMADALGISLEDWNTAKENAREAAQAQALEDGLITQEQIDLMEAHQALRDVIDKDELMAEVLGVSVEDVSTAKEDRTMRELVEESGLTPAELREGMDNAFAAAVKDAVTEGFITAEQAELIESAPHFGPGGPGGRGHHGRRGGPGGFGRSGEAPGGQSPAPAANGFAG